MRGPRQIHARDLQIPAIDVAVMQRDCSRDCHFFEAAAALAVVAALSVPDVVESVGIFVVPERRRSQFRARVVAERVVPFLAVERVSGRPSAS